MDNHGDQAVAITDMADFKANVAAYMEKEIAKNVEALKSLAEEIAVTFKLPYEESIEKVSKLLFIESDTRELINASKLCGQLDGLFCMAVNLNIALPEDIIALKEWAYIINPSD